MGSHRERRLKENDPPTEHKALIQPVPLSDPYHSCECVWLVYVNEVIPGSADSVLAGQEKTFLSFFLPGQDCVSR
jgi:hypothetical protein